MKSIGAKCLAAALWAAGSTAALAEEATMVRCITDGAKTDFKLVGSAWLERKPDKADWTPKGCGTSVQRAGATVRMDCTIEGDARVAVTTTTWPNSSSTWVTRETLLPKVPSYEVAFSDRGVIGDRDPTAGSCAILASEDARPEDSWSLSRKLAAGLPFLIVTAPDGVTLRPGDWEYPKGRWVVLEGSYYVNSGTWSARGVGFDPGRTNSAHSCPPYALLPKHTPPCGGIHQPGYTMDRWYKPDQRDLVVFGHVYRFDESGALFAGDKRVGRVLVPDF